MVRRTRKLPYKNGTWFAVPLRGGGFAKGIVVRMNGKGCVFGYFFGPKCDFISFLDEICELQARDAILVTQFGDLGLIKDEWPIIGNCDNWEQEKWPMPPFIRIDEISGNACLVVYSDDLNDYHKEPCAPGLVSKYPYDSLSGSGAVELKLTMLLDPESLRDYE